jgi:hypothetical protein
MKTQVDRIVNLKAKAFAGGRIEDHRFAVSPDGTVRVWDSVAGHYTNCHCLSASAIRRIRKAAKDCCSCCGRDPMLCECQTAESADVPQYDELAEQGLTEDDCCPECGHPKDGSSGHGTCDHPSHCP